MRRPAPAPISASGIRSASVGALFGSHLARQEDLCAALEDLADSLPHQIDTHFGLVLARRLQPTLCRAHRFEETVVFPLLAAQRKGLSGTLARLHGEHLEDEDQAGELSDAIASLIRDRSRRKTETVSYMLRGFFIGLGRHLAFEREHLLPLVEDARRP